MVDELQASQQMNRETALQIFQSTKVYEQLINLLFLFFFSSDQCVISHTLDLPID